MKSARNGLPALSSQRDAILDDWASCAFTPAEMAAKYQCSVASIMSNIIGSARVAGDPRALSFAQVRAAKAKAAAAPEAPKSAAPGLAAQLGIVAGKVVVKHDYPTIGGQSHKNVITLSGGFRPALREGEGA